MPAYKVFNSDRFVFDKILILAFGRALHYSFLLGKDKKAAVSIPNAKPVKNILCHKAQLQKMLN